MPTLGTENVSPFKMGKHYRLLLDWTALNIHGHYLNRLDVLMMDHFKH